MSERNQCDGCQAGMPLRHKDMHIDEAGRPVMTCQKERYRPAAQPEPTRSQKLTAAGFTRRPTWHALPSDDEPEGQ